MRAIVLAAGKGSRLGVATQAIPKPMIAVNGKPVLEQNIAWLRHHGVTELYLNLHHRPEVITSHFGDGSDFGVQIRYSHEEHLLGTSGAVRRIADTWWQQNPQPFFVIYGDNLLSYDLSQVRSFHSAHGGLATIVVYEKEHVLLSGIVVTDAAGRIQRFIEKPRPDQVVSHLVNTGIYLLEPACLPYLPAGTPSDFGHDIFPSMLADSAPIYAVIGDGSLTAIDTPQLLDAARQLRQ